jgi:HK97 family phage major capsid protein/HK97 family phage prohead protease
MKLKPQTRFLSLDSEIKVDANARTLTFPFSSEMPVQRWYGSEILVHDEKSMDASRLNNSAPLLFNHNLDDVIGVVERAWVNAQDRRGYATVRFAKTARADEVLGMVQDRILPNVSFMYSVDDAIEDPKKNEMRVQKFTPLEISVVTVPADQTVGIGRAWANEETEVRVTRIEATQAPEQRAITQTASAGKEVAMTDVTNSAATVVTEPELQKQSPIAYEQQRKQAIINLVRANKLDERIGNAWISQGASMEQVSKDILQILEERSKDNQSAAHIGMEPKEIRKFSLMRAIKASASGNWSEAQLEREASEEVAKRSGRDGRTANSFFLPVDVQQRDLTVGTDSAGGYLRATNNLSFIEILRNRMVAYRMGARRLSGLQGNVTIPKQTTAATAYWLSTEATAITEGNQVFGQLALTPRTVGAYTQVSRLLQLQSSPDVDSIIMSDLSQQVAIAADKAVLAGTGTEQPTGISGTSGIGSVSGTSLAAAGVLEFQSDVATNNALSDSCGYVTTPVVGALLMARPELPSTGTTRIWTGSLLDGAMLGFKAMTSAQMAAGTMLFGAWDQVVIGEWGVLEIAVNPNDVFAQGITGIRAMYTMDMGLRYAGAFSYASSVT